jgi:hypothetical protein
VRASGYRSSSQVPGEGPNLSCENFVSSKVTRTPPERRYFPFSFGALFRTTYKRRWSCSSRFAGNTSSVSGLLRGWRTSWECIAGWCAGRWRMRSHRSGNRASGSGRQSAHFVPSSMRSMRPTARRRESNVTPHIVSSKGSEPRCLSTKWLR